MNVSTRRLLVVEVRADDVWCGACEHADAAWCELFRVELTESVDGFRTMRHADCLAAEHAAKRGESEP